MKNALLKVLRYAQVHRCALNDEDRRQNLIKSFITMKVMILLTAITCLQASARDYNQGISLTLKKVSLEKVFAAIEKQSHYHFIYTKEELAELKPVSIDIKNVSIADAMELCLKEQPLHYELKEPYIIIKRKEESKAKPAAVIITTIRGKVVNERGEPVAGATISITGTTIATACNEKGDYTLNYTGNYTTLLISSVGYERQEVTILNRTYIDIVLKTAVNILDETIVMAYGKTTKRLSTGNISKVSAEEISKQPVANPLAALSGRVPGLVITQSNGVPGSSFQVQIRGKNSIAQGSDPLFIIDGVPFAANNTTINQLSSSAAYSGNQGLSPFNSINPNDIESIEILKDADATAIYGSRGANGGSINNYQKREGGNYNYKLQCICRVE